MLPIPKNVLKYKVGYQEKINGSGRYDEGYKTKVNLNHVYIEVSNSITKSGEKNERKNNKSFLVLDAVNSKPFIKPVINSKIIYNNEEFIIKTVKEISGNNKIHHYEVELL